MNIWYNEIYENMQSYIIYLFMQKIMLFIIHYYTLFTILLIIYFEINDVYVIWSFCDCLLI